MEKRLFSLKHLSSYHMLKGREPGDWVIPLAMLQSGCVTSYKSLHFSGSLFPYKMKESKIKVVHDVQTFLWEKKCVKKENFVKTQNTYEK